MFKFASDKINNSYTGYTGAGIPVTTILPDDVSLGNLVYSTSQQALFVGASEGWSQISPGVTPSGFSDDPIVVAVTDVSDSNSYVLTAGSGITITDGGPGSVITIASPSIADDSTALMAVGDLSYSDSLPLVAGSGINVVDGGAGGTFQINKDALRNEFVILSPTDDTLPGSRVLTAGEGISITPSGNTVAVSIDGVPANTGAPYLTWEEDATELLTNNQVLTGDQNIIVGKGNPQINGTVTVDLSQDFTVFNMTIAADLIASTAYLQQVIFPQYPTAGNSGTFACYTDAQNVVGTFDSTCLLQPQPQESGGNVPTPNTPGTPIQFYYARVGRLSVFVWDFVFNYAILNTTGTNFIILNLPLNPAYNFPAYAGFSSIVVVPALLVITPVSPNPNITVFANMNYDFSLTQNQAAILLPFPIDATSQPLSSIYLVPGSISYITDSDFATT